MVGVEAERAELMDAVALNDSPLVGSSASSICLRRQYGIDLIAAASHDAKNSKRLHQIIFNPGDVLLVQGPSASISGIFELLGCLPLSVIVILVAIPLIMWFWPLSSS